MELPAVELAFGASLAFEHGVGDLQGFLEHFEALAEGREREPEGARLLLVPGDFDWADIGNWSELGDRVHPDARGNSVEGEAVLVDTHGSLVLGDRRLVAAIGLEDMIIVDTEDALLVCPRSRAQDVKRVVDALRRARKTRYL